MQRVAVVFALPCTAALFFLPFLSLRPNRIVSGEPVYLWQEAGAVTLAALVALAVIPVFIARHGIRALLALTGFILTMFLAGLGAQAQLAGAGEFARVSLGGGFWIAAGCFALAAVDGLTRLAPGPAVRLLLTLLSIGCIGWALSSGWFKDLSLMQEYRVNTDVFASALRTHLFLVGTSMLPALAIGLPLGRICYTSPRWRSVTMPILNILQTTPSIALFGLLMVPLASLVSAIPELRHFGIGGIGATPAIIALTLYSLLPIVTNTAAGFAAVPAHSREAGRAMGMTHAALLSQVELPLAAPIILTGVRIVVVQNIGLATIAALIGGGGFGTLVFRGMGQTAMDLVLLGTLPVVALAITATILFDAAIDFLQPVRA